MTASHPQDLIAAVTHPNPYPYYADLVAHRPLYYDDGLKMWVASSAEMVTAVLTSDLCRVRPTAEPIPHAIVGSPSGDIFQHLIRMNDGEKHDPMKQAVSTSLHMGMMDRVEAESRQCAESLFKDLKLASSAEKIMDFAFHLPVYVVASLLGVPETQLSQTAQWVGDFVRGLVPSNSVAQIEQGKDAAHHLRAMLEALLDDSRESLLTSLSRESTHIDQTNQDVIAANAVGLLMQSYDATAGLIANTLRLFATQPRIYWHAQGSWGRVLLQEVLRYDSPVQNTRRFVAQDGLIGGQLMKAGDAILVVLAAANRDPLANARPEQFDIFRQHRRLFTFGIGAHACPGEHMALSIAEAAIERFVASGMALDQWAGPIAYHPSANARIALLETRQTFPNHTHFYL